MREPKVQILLSTYNGEQWLDALWESLLAQHWREWQLLVRDDGSTDHTIDIIKRWVIEQPEKVTFLADQEHLGSKASFNRLIAASDADYLCFCDQDDVWLPKKIQSLMIEMRSQEGKRSKRVPLLVHSDLLVTDSELNTLHASFWQFRKFKTNQPKQDFFVQNTVTGCAALFNRAAAKLAFPTPRAAMEHDRWLALCVSWFGYIAALPMPLLKYRQHENNQIGAVQQPRSIQQSVQAWSYQASIFLVRYADRLELNERDLVIMFASLRVKTRWQRRLLLWRNQVRKSGILPNIALFAMP